jgi:hypothetical protein
VGSTAATGAQLAHASPISCLLAKHTPAARQLFFFGAMLLCGPLALCGTMWAARRCGKDWALGGHELASWVQHAWVVAAILFQPAITKQVFALLPTVHIDGTSYLASDMSVAVGSPEYHSVLLLVAATIVVFVVGIPVAALRVLRNPEHRFAPAFAFVFGSFSKEKRWWAVALIWRKTAITAAVAVLPEPWQQLYVATWILALSLVTHAISLPYARRALNGLVTKMLSSAALIMALSLAIPIGFAHASIVETVIGVAELGTIAWLVQLALRQVTAQDVADAKEKVSTAWEMAVAKVRQWCCCCSSSSSSDGGGSSKVLMEPLLTNPATGVKAGNAAAAEPGAATMNPERSNATKEVSMRTSNVLKYSIGQRVANIGASSTSGQIVNVVADQGTSGPGSITIRCHQGEHA